MHAGQEHEPHMYTPEQLAMLQNHGVSMGAQVPHVPVPPPVVVQPYNPNAASVAAFSPAVAPPQEVKLEDGRVIVLQKPNRPMKLVVAKALGFHSMNPMMAQMYEAATYVRSINGIATPMLKDAKDFDMLITQLGDDGIETVMLEALFKTQVDALTEAETKAAAKN